MLKRTLSIAALMMFAGSALAQDKPAAPAAPAAPATEKKAQPTAKLAIGDAAPAFEVEKFLKGNEVTGFEKGRVYVVEFWATWCGPCIAAMPHISKLQKQYKDNVTIIGVNIWEDREYNEKTFAKAADFVKAQGDRMAYTVAFDGNAKKMDTNYMKAAGRNGIPSAFVVDQDSKIAWMGHPMWLDAVLADVVAKKWDIKTSPAKLQAAEKTLGEIMGKAQKDGKGALTDWTAFEKEHPAVAEVMSDTKLRLLLSAGEFTEAYKIMSKQADEAIASKDAMKLNEIAWTIVDPDGGIEKKDLDLAYRAATKGAEFAKGTDEEGMILDTVARIHFIKGETDKAIEIQTKAIEVTKNANMKSQLEGTLKEYQDAKNKK
jgi:thiol-disulfide isomerase/thioredoxin